jgi:hypothetical protein
MLSESALRIYGACAAQDQWAVIVHNMEPAYISIVSLLDYSQIFNAEDRVFERFFLPIVKYSI